MKIYFHTALMTALMTALCIMSPFTVHAASDPPAKTYTPNMTWASIRQLPKLGQRAWNPQPEYIATQIVLTALQYPPLKPEYLAQSKAQVQRILDGKAEFKQASCAPSGMVRTIWYTGAPVFLFQPGNRLVLAQYAEFREIFMDGRPHPANLDSNQPTIKYNGHSIGWWEGNTLVIDTVGVNPGHEIYYGVAYGGPNHIVERYELVDPQTLRATVTVDAPQVLAKPWVITKTYTSMPGGLGDGPGGMRGSGGGGAGTIVCDPNESRQKVDAEGNVHLDLTPPPPGIK